MTKKENKKISKFLSFVLRHKPSEIGLSIDIYGWANVHDLLKKMDIQFKDLKEVVETNDKKRFTFSNDYKKIRANQGHSIKVDLKLKPSTPPKILYHGTEEKNLTSILEKGIIKQNRNYIHLSADVETAMKVGMRHGRPAIIKVNALKMYLENYTFYISENGVWLTDFVPIKYLEVTTPH